VRPGGDLDRSTGELIRQIMLVMAQRERWQMLERIAEARGADCAVDTLVRKPSALRLGGHTVAQILPISASVQRALEAPLDPQSP
jgi:DNA invertase Pin-like site-specific DNA recombinase